MIAYTGISARPVGWLVQASNQFLFPPYPAAVIAVTLLALHVTG